MWGGRFSEATDAFVAEFTASVQFDQRFYKQDIAGSIAHATMLGEQGIIPQADADKIVAGLRDILADVKAGKITWRYRGEMYSIGIGRTHTGTRVIILAQDLDIRVIDTATGELLRELVLDTSKRYQATGRPPGPTQ